MVESSNYPGKKLLDPSNYGFEEYLIVALLAFIVFVAIKHLIFHTLYFWWYRYGQFYIPDRLWSAVTGKNLSQRVVQYVNLHYDPDKSLQSVMLSVDEYFETKEFAPSLGDQKGKILDGILVEHKPNIILVVGCHIGYCILRILNSCPSSVIYVVERNPDFILAAKKLLQLTEHEAQVIFVCGHATEVLQSIRDDYGIDKFDFIFLNRLFHDEPSHLQLLHKLEGESEKNPGFLHHANDSKEGRRTVVLADKVVMLGDPEYLKYVRQSGSYETKYYQMPLEHSSHEIVDGMESVIYIK